MTVGPVLFGLLVWGAIGLVLAVFAYELYAVLAEASSRAR